MKNDILERYQLQQMQKALDTRNGKKSKAAVEQCDGNQTIIGQGK